MRTTAPTRQALARSAAFALASTIAVALGRLTVIEGTGLSLVWPAAGVAVLWALVQQRAGTWLLDAALLFMINLVVNQATGATPVLAVSLAVANLVQVGLLVYLTRRWCPSARTGDALVSLGRLGGFLGAVLVATAVGSVLGPGAVAVATGDWSWLAAAVWLTRHAVGVVVVVPLGLWLVTVVRDHRDRTEPGAADPGWPSRWQVAELVLAVVVTAAAYVLVFKPLAGLPVAFPLLVLTVWVALRFPTPVVVLHSSAVAVVAVWLTLSGHGPFAAIVDHAVRGLVVQAFVGLVAVLGLTLALGRDERQVLLARVTQQAADVAVLARTSRAVLVAEDVRTAICSAVQELTGADGVHLLEPDGQGDLVSTSVVGLELPPVRVDAAAEDSLSAAVFRGGPAVFLSDVAGAPALSDRLATELHVRAAACHPVRAHAGEVVAVIGMLWHRPTAGLSAHVSGMLETLSREAAHAIERGDLLAQLAQAAGRDPLTGLANRRQWDEHGAREVARATRTGQPLTFCLVDLDHFKRYNDTRGHLAGDVLLREFAVAAADCLRDIDTLARWGGEEFALALPDCTAADAVAVADRIRAAVPHGQTCTVGIAQWQPGQTVAQALECADEALYTGKRNGRDAVVIASQPVRVG